MGGETVLAENTYGYAYPIEDSCGKEEDAFYSDSLENGTPPESGGEIRTAFNQAAPLLSASWLSLAVLNFSYVQTANELSRPLQELCEWIPQLNRDQKHSAIFLALLFISTITYLCLSIFLVHRFCRKSGLVAALFLCTVVIGPCAVILGANANEIQLLLMPLVLNTAITTVVLRMRKMHA